MQSEAGIDLTLTQQDGSVKGIRGGFQPFFTECKSTLEARRMMKVDDSALGEFDQ